MQLELYVFMLEVTAQNRQLESRADHKESRFQARDFSVGAEHQVADAAGLCRQDGAEHRMQELVACSAADAQMP